MPKQIKATGPVPCDYMLIAERPGIVESKVGRVLCGPSGQELDRYLLVNAGIDRSAVYCTNLVKTYAETPPTADEIAFDHDELWDELHRVQPTYLGLVGLHSARNFLGDVDMEWSHGLCFPVEWGFSVTHMMPLYHPAAGLHQPNIAAKVAWDFTQFGKMIRGEKLPTGHLYNPIEPNYGIDNGTGIGIAPHGYVGVDTEGTVESPWCMSWSDMPGRARVNRDGCPIDGLTVLHSAIHDLPVLESMGVRPEHWTDTHLMAALLGIEPQGLKALARRHCGMVCKDYVDIIAPARYTKGIEYLSRAVDWAYQQELSKNENDSVDGAKPILNIKRNGRRRTKNGAMPAHGGSGITTQNTGSDGKNG